MELPITSNTVVLISQFFSIYIIIGFSTLVIEQAINALISAKNA